MESADQGLTRHEISVLKPSGMLDKLNGQVLGLDKIKQVWIDIKSTLDQIRKPLLTKRLLSNSIWAIHLDETLELFAHLPTNIVIIGERKLTFLYCQHQFPHYITG